jgi:hypothetical protein
LTAWVSGKEKAVTGIQSVFEEAYSETRRGEAVRGAYFSESSREAKRRLKAKRGAKIRESDQECQGIVRCRIET